MLGLESAGSVDVLLGDMDGESVLDESWVGDSFAGVDLHGVVDRKSVV